MKVKIGDKIYDSEEQMIMVILDAGDKERISNMSEDATEYCCYPDGVTTEEVLKFMDIEGEE